jgi:hypothetical protein
LQNGLEAEKAGEMGSFCTFKPEQEQDCSKRKGGHWVGFVLQNPKREPEQSRGGCGGFVLQKGIAMARGEISSMEPPRHRDCTRLKWEMFGCFLGY